LGRAVRKGKRREKGNEPSSFLDKNRRESLTLQSLQPERKEGKGNVGILMTARDKCRKGEHLREG